MNKKVILVIGVISFLFVGCNKVKPTIAPQPNNNSNITAALTNDAVIKSQSNESSKSEKINSENTNTQPENTAATNKANNSQVEVTKPSTNKVNDSIDYSQYTKKVWVVNNAPKNNDFIRSSFCISEIKNGQITGLFTVGLEAIPNKFNYWGQLTGTISNNVAECQFSANGGNKGTIKLIFKSNNEIEAVLKFSDKAETYKAYSMDGTFDYKPYNVKDIIGLNCIDDQSFLVNLDSWGYVKFVSAKETFVCNVPIIFYLTNKVGDIFYDFGSSDFPYGSEVKAVSFQDVNKDGLKDIIIISSHEGKTVVIVYFQKPNSSFDNNATLDKEINDSGNNKDIKSVLNYLATKF